MLDTYTNRYTASAPYTAAEKQWLNDNFGGEFHFLLAYGLSIHKEDDREEGRAIARAMMAQDARG